MTQPEPTITDFSVITEDVEQNSVSMNASVQDIAGELAALRSFVSGTEDFWQGQDHTAFLELMAGFDTNATSLNTALGDIAAGLKGNAANYTAAGSQNQSMLAAVHQNLPPATF